MANTSQDREPQAPVAPKSAPRTAPREQRQRRREPPREEILGEGSSGAAGHGGTPLGSDPRE